MQPAQHAFGRSAVIVLYEIVIDAHFGERSPAPAFHEETAFVPKHARLDLERPLDGEAGDLHWNAPPPSSRRSRYSPYPLLRSRCASSSSWASSMKPSRQAISSGQAILRPCRSSVMRTYCAASRSEAWVPVSSQA